MHAQSSFGKMLIRSFHQCRALVAHNVLYEGLSAVPNLPLKTASTLIGLPDAPIVQGVDECASWPRA